MLFDENEQNAQIHLYIKTSWGYETDSWYNVISVHL